MITFTSVLVVAACIAICASENVKLPPRNSVPPKRMTNKAFKKIFSRGKSDVRLILYYPDGFIICKRNDPDMDTCLQNAAKPNHDLLAPGYAEIDFPRTNPMLLDHLDFRIGDAGGQLTYSVALDNIVAEYNILNFNSFKLDTEKKKYFVVEQLEYLKIKANHTSIGKLFFGQVNGKGACTVHFVNPLLEYDITYSENEKNGVMYTHVDTLNLKITTKKIQGYFENLIGRDKNINDSLNKVINENWKLVYGPVIPVIEKEIAKILKDFINRFFDKVPLDQIYPE